MHAGGGMLLDGPVGNVESILALLDEARGQGVRLDRVGTQQPVPDIIQLWKKVCL